MALWWISLDLLKRAFRVQMHLLHVTRAESNAAG